MEEIELSSVDEFEQDRLAINKAISKLIRYLVIITILLGGIYWYKDKVQFDEIAFHQREKDLVFAAYLNKVDGLPRKETPKEIPVNSKETPVKKVSAKKLEFDFTNLAIPRKDMLSGGVPKNKIPALINPKMLSASEDTYINDDDEVAGLSIDGEAHAFPLRILNYHEAVNTKVGNHSVAITYCPLCKSLVAYDRIHNDQELTFRISGQLFNSNVLLYTEGQKDDPLYSQMMNTQISGENSGNKLKIIPIELTSWKSWKKRYPDTKVMSAKSKFYRNYTVNPYYTYFLTEKLMFPIKKHDDRHPRKAIVLGLWSGDTFQAYPVREFVMDAKSKEINVTINNKNVTIYYDNDAKSLRVVKADKGVEWMYSFWFAWYAFHPETELYSASR